MSRIIWLLILATIFIALVLIFLPAWVLEGSGIQRPPSYGPAQIGGLVIGTLGGLLALWCILTFVFIGKGTPFPFDPPRRLVVRGPYRFSRNPMLIGVTLTLLGAAMFYTSLTLLSYAGLLFVVVTLFILLYEEPHLRRTFGEEYEAYCRRVRRWL
jgi:protein-S-isoprenylcysteine O-methyltransferase Ste14